MTTSSAHKIIEALTSKVIQDKLGITEFSILAAKRKRRFPARWYAPIKQLCDEKGIECPIDAFTWAGSDKGSQNAKKS